MRRHDQATMVHFSCMLRVVSSVLLGAVQASSPPIVYYTKLTGTDSGPGGALHWKQCVANCTCAHRSGPCPIAALEQLCAATPHCAGFNSNGWLKSCVSTSCGQTQRPSAGCDLYVGSKIPPGPWPPPPPPPKKPVAPPGPAPGPWHPQPPGPPPPPLPPMPPVSPPAPVPQVADWHYPNEESAERAAMKPISILSVNATANISGSILMQEEKNGPSTPSSAAAPQRLAVGESSSSGWTLRSFIVSSAPTDGHGLLLPPIAVLERDWGRWGLVVYVQQQQRVEQQEDRMLPISLLEGRSCPGIITANGGQLPTACFAVRKGVGDTSALERPRYQLEAADPDYFIKARDIPTDWLKARMLMTADGEPTFNSAASLLPPSKDYTMVGNVAAHTKISVSPDGRLKSGNSSIFVAMEWGNITGGSLLFDPRDHVAYWPVHNFSEYKSAVIGRFTRAVSVSAWDKAAQKGFAMLVTPNIYRGIQRGGGKGAAAYDPAEVLVRLEEHGSGAKAIPAQYFAVQDCGSFKSPLCYSNSTRALPDGGQFYAHLLLHTLEWDRFHAPPRGDNNVASKRGGVASVRPLQLSLKSPAAESEGTRMVDMSRAVISSAMTMYLNNRPNYGDGSVYWSVTAHDAGSLPLESFALNRALLLWGHPHEAASRVEFYLNTYVRNSSGWTPTNPAGMTRNKLWNSSGHGPPGSLDLKQWGCGHGPGEAVMPHNFQESLADYGRWLELWVELARVMEHEEGGIAWIERTWSQVNELVGYTVSLHSEAIQAQHPFPAAGLIVGPAEHDTCAYYGPFFSISAWTWRGWKAIYSFLVDTGAALPQAGAHREALPSQMDTLSRALDAAVNASLVKNDTNQPYFLPPIAQVNAPPYTSMIMRGAEGTSGSSSYANFRYFAEMLSSGYFSDDIAHAISDFRESHTGTLSGMTRFLDHLDDMPAEGYAQSALELSRVQSFQALLFGHAANYHSRGVYNAPEQLSLYGDGVPGRWTYSDSYRAYLKGAVNEVDIDFCVPSTTLPAIMLRWMMLFTERDKDVIALFRAAPRRFFRPSPSSQATVNTIELVGGVTRYGSVDSNVSVASTSTGLSIRAGIVLRMHGRGFVTSASKQLRLEVRLRSPKGYRLVAANVSAAADVDVSVIDIDRDTDTVILLLKPGSGPSDYDLSLVASSRLSGTFDEKHSTLSLASAKRDDVGTASAITYTRIPNTTTGDTLRLKRCTVNITCSGTPTCCYNPHGPHPGGRGLFCAIPQLEEACRSTPGCAGFDTDGWLKADVSGARTHGTSIDTYIGSSKAPGQFPPPEPLPPPPAPAPPGPPTPAPPHGPGNPLHKNVTGVVDVEHADHIGSSFLEVFVGWGACTTTLCSRTELESGGVFQRCFAACKAHDQCGLWVIAPKYVHGSTAPNCWLMESYGQRQLNLGYWSMCTELAADGTCRQIQKPKMETYRCNGTQCVPGAGNLSFTDPSCFGQCSSERLKHDDVDPQQPTLFAPRFTPLDVGAVVPEGWLLKQLMLQAEGLSGHLISFWPDVQHSMWLNGANIHGDKTGNHSERGHYKDDGGLHERGTYWLNGFVPLAFQLSAAGVETLYPKCDRQSQQHKDSQAQAPDERVLAEPVRPMEQMRTFIDAILASVNTTDGWIGPGDRPTISDSGHPPDGGIYWGRSNALQSLIQYAEGQRSFGGGDPAEFDRVAHVVKNYFLCQQRMMTITPLEMWSRSRWIDMALSVAWVIDNASPTVAEMAALMELGAQLHKQGDNWEEWFQFAGPGGRGTGISFEKGHNVNNAQALKWSAVLYRFTGNATLRRLGLSSMANIDQHYGLPTGMFNGDEILPDPPTRNPSRGIETCGVVEAMFSYTTLGAVHGDVAFFDRAERIAFNALPAAWASPRGGDMWAHPYLQSVNEVQAIEADPHIWEHDDHWAETFGLQPTFGCCTANFNQGWPKLIKQAVMATPDGGAAVALLIPTNATLSDGGTVTVETTYPFEDIVRISCKPGRGKPSFPLQIRVPAWAKNASINGKRVAPGEFSHQTCAAAAAVAASSGGGVGSSSFLLELAPQIVLEEWAGDLNVDGEAPHTAYSVVRGPLLYSLPIEHDFIEYAHHYGSGDEASNDYFLTPGNNSVWNYALVVDPHDVTKGLRFVPGEPHAAGAAPFNRTGPLAIQAQARRVPKWSMFANSAAPPPQSPACGDGASSCGPVEAIMLVPHGYTELRIGEFSLA